MRHLLVSTALACGVLAVSAGPAFAQSASDEVLSGEVSAPQGHVDFPISLEAGELVTLTTDSEENFDTILSIVGPGGRTLAENDDIAPGVLQSQIVFQAPAAGDYTASVTGYGGATGAFELEIHRGLDLGLSSEARSLLEEIVTLDRGRSTATRSVSLEAGEILVATTFALSDNLDTTLTLQDASGTAVSQNDDRGDGSLNSQIVFQAEEAGEFEIRIGSFSGQDVGDLVLSLAVDPNAEVPFDFTSIEGEALASYRDTLGRDPDSRSYTVSLEEGQTLFAMADTLSGDLDPVLRMTGPDGYPVALNDDRGDGSLNSAFAYTAPETADYTLEIRRYHGSDTSGEYELVLSLVDASVVDTLQELSENRISLSGEVRSVRTADFVVYYTLEGDDEASEDYAVSVGEALQEMYDIQINQQGWAEPVRDDEGLYRAFIADAGGSMGVTYPVEIVFDNPHTPDVRETAAARPVFLIENDFRGLGKEAPVHALMRATATHEFAHVVQYGYDSEEGLDWLFESTASWIETTTVGADQDATDYVARDYADPQYCWTTSNDGFDYSQWTLLQSIADVHGEDLIVQVWENSVELDGFETMAAALQSVETTIPDVLERWRAQNFARDYDLAPLFDATVEPRATITEPETWRSKGGLEELGANYFPLELDGRFTVSLDGDPQLALFALGVRDGEVHVVPLGNSGAVDMAGWDYLGLMVFNSAMPAAPGECTDVGYSLTIAPGDAPMRGSAYRFDARHFEPLREAED